MLKEFKEFALRGNVLDLAVGVIIGAAFSKIIDSFVTDIVMPVIGAATGGLDYSNYFLKLSSNVTATTLVEAKKQGAVLAWGNFLSVAVNFILVAFILFLFVRAINSLRRKEAAAGEAPAAPAAPPRNEVLLEEIRDLLAKDAQAKR
jgi:large conductance mechanosensitive channel